MLCLLVCVPYIGVYMLYLQAFLDFGFNRLRIITLLMTKTGLKISRDHSNTTEWIASFFAE